MLRIKEQPTDFQMMAHEFSHSFNQYFVSFKDLTNYEADCLRRLTSDFFDTFGGNVGKFYQYGNSSPRADGVWGFGTDDLTAFLWITREVYSLFNIYQRGAG